MFFKLRALKDFANFRGNTCVGASLLEKQKTFQLPLFFFYLFSTLPDNEEFKTQIYFTAINNVMGSSKHENILYKNLKQKFYNMKIFKSTVVYGYTDFLSIDWF